MKRLLIVDDELNMQKVLGILFRKENYEVTTVSNGKEAVDLLDKGVLFDLILSDIKMPVMDGIELLKYLKKSQINIPMLLITAYGSITEAVDAMKLGAVDFITKPFNKEDLKNIVYRAVHGEKEKYSKQNKFLRNDNGVIYSSNKMQKIMETVRKIAPSKLSILLTGESGTGKGILAQAIHNYAFHGSELKAPFVSINCPALPDTLLESELFGYKKGAFTGADKNFPGKVSLANGGTLFLDEIGDLSMNVQSKLLKLLEEGIYSPLGSTKEYKAHIRIISATNQSITKMVKEKKFREDLYYRINSVMIEIPPLRTRKEDILPLVEFFIKRFSNENNKNIGTISDEGLIYITRHYWPGNIRELRNVIHRAVVLSSNDKLLIEDFPVFDKDNNISYNFSMNVVKKNERELVLKVLTDNSWNISAAARELGISRGSLRYRITKYSLEIG